MRHHDIPNMALIEAVVERLRRVIGSVPERLDPVWAANCSPHRFEARNEARHVMRANNRLDTCEALSSELLEYIFPTMGSGARIMANDLVRALTAWDDAAQLFEQDLDVLRIAAAAGNPAAVLMLPAKVALSNH
jgi:hypothetical protein